jgi:TRAP-type C4-dicarboxylate transport system permease small subunit
MLATVFIGAAYTLKTGGHIRITVATERFSQKVQAPLDLFVSFVSVVVGTYMSWYFWKMVIHDYRSMATDLSALSMPLWIPKSVMAAGFSLLVLQFVADIIGSLRKTKSSIPPGRRDNEKPKRRLKR